MKLSSFESVVRALNEGRVPFILVGGLAVNAHGYGRQTLDMDLVHCTRETMTSDPEWTVATWAGNRRQQHLEFLRLPFRRKLEIIEELGEVSMFFAERRRARGLPVSSRTLGIARERS